MILELAKREDVIFTPHNAFNTNEAVEQKALQSVTAIIHCIEHGMFPQSILPG